MERPSWDTYFLTIARLTAERSNCIRRRVGCIVVKDNRILSLGYNGTPRGFVNCFEGGCTRCMEQARSTEKTVSGVNLDLCMCLHAEENAMLFVGQKELEESTMYVTVIPCISCVKKILQCGIKRVVYMDGYNPDMDDISLKALSTGKIEVLQLRLVQKSEKEY